MTAPDRIPVIIGVGEINDRPAPDQPGLDSVELMAAAARAADQDAGGGWLSQCDWLASIPQISFREYDVPVMLPKALGIAPRRVSQAHSPDGDSPVRHINDAANAIGSGEASVCLLVGGEAVRTSLRRAAAAGNTRPLFAGAVATATDLRRRYGLITPADIYPLYENATRAGWGQTFDEGQAESGEIWSRLSRVAAEAEGAWIKTPRTAREIAEFTADNRPIAFPYSKLMVANSSVNQGAALIVTSLAKVRSAGISEDRIVYIGAGAAAHEENEPLARAEWTSTPSMDVALDKVMELNGLSSPDLDHVELYSCFPCVPKMARRKLGLSTDRPLTVHGGLTFGGGPIGNYMTHAAAAMVRKLRTSGEFGLLYGNGGHCTHNHAIVLARRPVAGASFPQDYHFQAEADARRGAVPSATDDYEGPAVLETYTVFYGRDGTPQQGVVLARNPAGDRIVSRIDGNDEDGIAFLTKGVVEPVGTQGHTVRQGEMLTWKRS
jgi:acetyl-CoA C-acetyltransferase